MGSLVMCKIDVSAQDLVLPSLSELSARLEVGALKFGLLHFAAPEIFLNIGQGHSQSLVSDNDFALDDGPVVCCSWEREKSSICVPGRLSEERTGVCIVEYDAAFDLADERDDWIQGGTLLEQILDAAIGQEEI
jgi:hypothetical protein